MNEQKYDFYEVTFGVTTYYRSTIQVPKGMDWEDIHDEIETRLSDGTFSIDELDFYQQEHSVDDVSPCDSSDFPDWTL
jgi:hypothetical protein